MDQNMGLHYMTAQAEHKLMIARAEQSWRWMAAERQTARGSLIARLVAAIKRAANARPGRDPRTAATATGRQGSPSAC